MCPVEQEFRPALQYPMIMSTLPEMLRSSLNIKTTPATTMRSAKSDTLKFLQALVKRGLPEDAKMVKAVTAVIPTTTFKPFSISNEERQQQQQYVMDKVDPKMLTRLGSIDSALSDTESTLASTALGDILAEGKWNDSKSSCSSLSLSDIQIPFRKSTLVLDLDETLIHSTLTPRRPADFWVEVIQNGTEHTREIFHVFKRPHVDQFLAELAKHYDLVIFTAGIQEYASQILDRLDPENKLFKARYYRHSCTEIRGSFVKDLTRVNLNLRQVLLVDNTPNCFSLQPANGLPIKSWYTDLNDKELPRLAAFLANIADEEDVRMVLSEWSM